MEQCSLLGFPIGKDRKEREYSVPNNDKENIPYSGFPGVKKAEILFLALRKECSSLGFLS